MRGERDPRRLPLDIVSLKQKVKCEHCDKVLTRRGMARHVSLKHGDGKPIVGHRSDRLEDGTKPAENATSPATETKKKSWWMKPLW